MNKLIVSLLLTVGISGFAHAAGDAAAGQAKAAVCAFGNDGAGFAHEEGAGVVHGVPLQFACKGLRF